MHSYHGYFGGAMLLLYCLVSICIGWRNSKATAGSLEDYATGYSSISNPVLVSGILAAVLGAGSIIGEAGRLFSMGLPFMLVQTLNPVSWWIMSKIFPRNLPALKAEGCLSISHVMGYLYGKTARWITTILAFAVDLGVVTAQMMVVAGIVSSMFVIPADIACIISFLMITTFSLMGGIRTIAQTGILQFSLFFILFPASYLLISYQYGGFEGLSAKLPIMSWGIGDEQFSSSNLLFLAIFALLPNSSSSFIQKCLIARNKKQLGSSLQSVGQIYIPIMISIWFIAYTVRVAAPELAPEQALFYYINEMCPVWMKGLLSVSLIAIIMGMSDGVLHANSVIFANDVVKVLLPKTLEKSLLRSAKAAIVALSFAAFCLASSGDIMSILHSVYSLWAPVIPVPLCAGFAGFATDKRSFFSSALTGIFAITAGHYLDFSSIAVIIAGVACSALGFFGGHLLFMPTAASAYREALRNALPSFKTEIAKQITIFKQRVLKDIFPKEEQMSVGQKDIYRKFCISMMIILFIYFMLIGTGSYHKIMGIMLIVGFVATVILMAKDIIFSHGTSKMFYIAFYGALILWPTVASYGLMCHNALLMNLSVLSLLVLGAFTNAITYLLSITIGFILSAICYKLGVNASIPYQFYFVYVSCIFFGSYFLHPQQEMVKESFSGQQMATGAISHEIRSPLAAVEMSLDIAKSILADAVRTKIKDGMISLEIDEESLKMLETFVANAHKGSKDAIKIIEMILMIAKTDKVDLPKVRFSFHDCAKRAIGSYVATNKSAASRIHLKIDKNWWGYGPEDFFEQVIHNMVKNGFTHGGKRADFAITLSNEDNKLVIEDNGVGIPNEHLPFIFDRFFTKSTSGTGIGLALSKLVVESMGGTITCESQVGEGSYTRFVMFIPQISETVLEG